MKFWDLRFDSRLKDLRFVLEVDRFKICTWDWDQYLRFVHEVKRFDLYSKLGDLRFVPEV